MWGESRRAASRPSTLIGAVIVVVGVAIITIFKVFVLRSEIFPQQPVSTTGATTLIRARIDVQGIAVVASLKAQIAGFKIIP